MDLLTTSEIYFFREPKHYDLLQTELPKLGNRAHISVWSAAASLWDKAFSTAMLMSDLQIMGRIGPDWSILATDISHRAPLSAKEAVYPSDRLRAVAPERLLRCCLRGESEAEGQVQMQDKLRARVQFGPLNLCKPFDGLGPFDIVFLRNVSIYIDPETTLNTDPLLALPLRGGLSQNFVDY